MEIKHQTAKVLCQDRVYSQPISFLSPEGKELNSLVGIDDAPGMALTDAFKNEEAENSDLTHTQPNIAQTNGDSAPI